MVDEGDATGAMMMTPSNFKNDTDMIEEEDEEIKLSNNNSTNNTNNTNKPNNNNNNANTTPTNSSSSYGLLNGSVGNAQKTPGIGG